jgi:hypothetical protein
MYLNGYLPGNGNAVQSDLTRLNFCFKLALPP